MAKVESRARRSERYDVLKLDSQLCFALYAATRAMTKTYRERLGPMGLTYPQYLVMMVLWEKDGMPVTAIGDELGLETSTLTPLIKRLEKLKLLTRKRSSDDERSVIVSLTPSGWSLREEAVTARRFVACQLDMSEREILAFRKDLLDLVGRLQGNKKAA